MLARSLALPILALLVSAAGAMDFASLERLIATRDVRSVEDLLPLLPSYLRSRYVLMFASRSLQGATFANPRVILFDPDARFVLSFNGDDGEPGFTAIETMEFDGASRSFRLREVSFAAKGEPAAPARISPPNPPRCLACHGDPARPIWDSPPSWPGAYGQRYDAALSRPEGAGLAQFLRGQPEHARYRYLLQVERFADPETFRAGARARYAGDVRVPPNAELGAALGRLNFQEIVRELESRPDFAAYRYALLGALGDDCAQIDSFFPPDDAGPIRTVLDRLAAAGARANDEQARTKELRAAAATGSERYAKGGPEPLDRFRFVAELGLGQSTDQWTMALEKGSYDFAWSANSVADMRNYLLDDIARADPEVKNEAADRSFDTRNPYCTFLSRRSRAALEAVRSRLATALADARADQPMSRESGAQSPALLQRCIACHAPGAGIGPTLPFDDATRLAARLREPHGTHGTLMDEIRYRLSPEAASGRMPLGNNASDGERAALLAYLGRLAADSPAAR